MNYKIKSALVVFLFLAILIVMSLFLGINHKIVGLTISNSIACYENSDCDDGIPATQDLCRSPGTTNSICINKAIK